jgi:hypothetical protein
VKREADEIPDTNDEIPFYEIRFTSDGFWRYEIRATKYERGPA